MQLTFFSGVLNLEIDGFAYGAPKAGRPYDYFDWLMVRVSVTEPKRGRAFYRNDPCLSVGDVIYLANWLCTVADDPAISGEAFFTEPNLAFGNRDGVLHLRLAAECKPPWSHQNHRHLTLKLTSTREEIAAAADDLKHNLIRVLPTAERDGVSSMR